MILVYCLSGKNVAYTSARQITKDKNRYIGRKIYPKENISKTEIFRKRYN